LFLKRDIEINLLFTVSVKIFADVRMKNNIVIHIKILLFIFLLYPEL
jgi:hypothetical protein